MNPMRYHRYAWKLAHRYYNPKSIHTKDDLYQIAMLGLLELWRKNPDASEALCVYAMKCEIRRAYTKEMKPKRQAQVLPIDEARRETAAEVPAHDVVANLTAEHIHSLIDRLPSDPQRFLLLKMSGANISAVVRREGLSHAKVTDDIRRARLKLRQWIGQEVV